MKKIMIAGLFLALMFTLASCGYDQNEQETTYSFSQSQTTSSIIDGYIRADYEKYNSPASENGLDGTLIYDDVLIKELKILNEGYMFLLVENNDLNQYIISVGAYPFYNQETFAPLVGSKARVFFEYAGFSSVFNLPAGHMIENGKIEISTGEVYEPASLKATGEQIKKWISENGTYIQINEIDNTEAQYVMLSGLATDVSQYSFLKEASVYLYGKVESGYESKYMAFKYAEIPFASELTDGDGLMVYGYISEGEFNPVYIELIDIPFTLEDIANDYKQKCKTFEYTTIARDPSLYTGKYAKFTGQVIQVLEDGERVTLRVNVTKKSYVYDDTLYVIYTRKNDTESRILEDDIITMYGTLSGLETYKSILGANITIPKMHAEYIEIN